MDTDVLKVAIIQRACPHYRIPLYQRINQDQQIDLTVIVNDPKVLEWDRTNLGFNLVYVPAMATKFDYGTKSYQIPISPGLAKQLWSRRYDVVIAEGVTNIVNNLIIYPMARLRGSHYIWWGAGRRRFAKKTIFRRMADPATHFMIRHADACIAYGSVAKEYMISVGADPGKVFIAQNTIDTSDIISERSTFGPQVDEIRQRLGLDGEKVILYVGVVEKRKKIENLILAYQNMRQQANSSTALVIVGGGPHEQALRHWTKDEFPDLTVHFLGKIIDGVNPYFAMCDVFVLPSEGGLALNQAMAMGKPVIATSADGTEVDLIKQGENGYIVTEDNITALANAMMTVLQDPVKQEAMGEYSAQLMEDRFTLNNMVKGVHTALGLMITSK